MNNFEKQIGEKPVSYLSLLPFLVFILLYLGSGIWFSYQNVSMPFYKFPAAASAFFGFCAALVVGRKNINGCIKTFTNGIGEENIILMCLIFLMAGAFSALAKEIGAVNATVNIGLSIIHPKLILPGLFIISCLVSFAMGTSMGTISALIPIALGIGHEANINVGLLAGIVVGGSMFGDNLSIISDTTIAATQTQGCAMKDKMKENFKIALPSALIVCGILLFFSVGQRPMVDFDIDLLKVVPYVLVLTLALLGINVLLVLVSGILSCIAIGLLQHSFMFFDVGQVIYNGFLSVVDVLFVTMLIAGLGAIAVKEGGIEFLFKKLSKVAVGKKSGELLVGLMVSFADICTANNTIAILLSGEFAKKTAQKFGITPARSASTLDIFSCVWQGILPYGAQILLASGLCQVSAFLIIPYTLYPLVLAFVTLMVIALRKS